MDVSPFIIHDMTIAAEGSTESGFRRMMIYKSAELANLSVKIEG